MKLLNERILQASNIIAGRTRRGPADYMIVSPKVAQIITEIYEEEEYKEKLRQRLLKIEKIRNGTKKS